MSVGGNFWGLPGKSPHHYLEWWKHIFRDVAIPFVPIFVVVGIQSTLNALKNHIKSLTISYNPRIPWNFTKNLVSMDLWSPPPSLQSRSRELQKLVYSPKRCSKRSSPRWIERMAPSGSDGFVARNHRKILVRIFSNMNSWFGWSWKMLKADHTIVCESISYIMVYHELCHIIRHYTLHYIPLHCIAS